MNAAFILVSSALLVGQGGDAKAPPAVGPGCGHAKCGCEKFGHKLKDKLHSLFAHDKCCNAAPACHVRHAPTPLFQSRCQTACKPSWTWHAPCREAKACCERGHPLLDRLRAALHHRDHCCHGGAHKTGDTPKSMPKGGSDKKTTEEVRIETPPAPNVRNVETEAVPPPVLAPAPRNFGDTRNP